MAIFGIKFGLVEWLREVDEYGADVFEDRVPALVTTVAELVQGIGADVDLHSHAREQSGILSRRSIAGLSADRLNTPAMPTPSRRRRPVRHTGPITGLPNWIAPQLSQLKETVPTGDQWAPEIKLDGYRKQPRLDGEQARLLTRTGLYWTEKYPSTARALSTIDAREVYIDGELCALAETGVPPAVVLAAVKDKPFGRPRRRGRP